MLTIDNVWRQPRVCEKKQWCVHTRGGTAHISLAKGDPAIRNNTDEPGGHCTEGNSLRDRLWGTQRGSHRSRKQCCHQGGDGKDETLSKVCTYADN